MIANIINEPVKKRGAQSNVIYAELACLSSDTKPTVGLATGSLAVEVDTGDVYLFDEEASVWNKMCSLKEE